MDQAELTSIFCARPQNFAWFLGAGASASAGLPTAGDILLDLKRLYYCREENQDVSRQDIQNEGVRRRLQSFMESRGFPPEGSDDEYSTYFAKVFGSDKERQRRYIRACLSERRIRLSVGNRVLGALIACSYSRLAFTTNFDNVVERAVAEVGGQSLLAYHLEGPHAALQALNNEEFPIYCKLHGDFRYDSLKNLPADLAEQNEVLGKCFVAAGNRVGFIVTGYSGRDPSVMTLFRAVLESPNPFPNGLFWTGIKGRPVPSTVGALLDRARTKGVRAAYVAIETYDALMLRLWRNTDSKPSDIDSKVRKFQSATVNIPLPPPGRAKPLLRFNALPVVAMPPECLVLSFGRPVEWAELHSAERASHGAVFLTKGDHVYGWGTRERLKSAFAEDCPQIETGAFPSDLHSAQNLHFRSLAESALCAAVVRGKPLLFRSKRLGTFVIANPHGTDKTLLDPLSQLVGGTSGTIADLSTEVTEEFPQTEPVRWSEAIQVSLEVRAERIWIMLDPEIWIWPTRARKLAAGFMDKRCGDRFNSRYNALLDVWIALLLGTNERNVEVTLKPLAEGAADENPAFGVSTRTAFSRRVAA